MKDQHLLKEYKNEFLKLDNVFWLTNLYGVLGQKKILTENEILAGFKRQDLAVTTIIADYIMQNPDDKYIKPLITAFNSFNCPVDAEPMIAILKALDVIKHDDLNSFFEKLASENKYKILFKSKKDYSL